MICLTKILKKMVNLFNYFVEYFEFRKDESKLIKTYQLLTQYMSFSINHLNKKNTLVRDLAQQQLNYNEAADVILRKQVIIYIFNLLERKNKTIRKPK